MSELRRFNSSNYSLFSPGQLAEPAGTLTWDATNGLRLHDGTTIDGLAIPGTYTNANVAAFLPTYNGNILADITNYSDGVSNIQSLNPATSGGINGLALTGLKRASTAIVAADQTWSYSWDFRPFGLDNYSRTDLPAIMFPGGTIISEDFSATQNNMSMLQYPTFIQSSGNLTVGASYSMNGYARLSKDWTFDTTGNLTSPSGDSIGNGNLILASGSLVSQTGNSIYLVSKAGGSTNIASDDYNQQVGVSDVGVGLSTNVHNGLAIRTWGMSASDTSGSFTPYLSGVQNLGSETHTVGNIFVGNMIANAVIATSVPGSQLSVIAGFFIETPFTNPIITVPDSSMFGNGQSIVISGVTSPAQMNGLWYLQSYNGTGVRIFSDAGLTTTPDATGWASYNHTGAIFNPSVSSNFGITAGTKTWEFNVNGSLTTAGAINGFTTYTPNNTPLDQRIQLTPSSEVNKSLVFTVAQNSGTFYRASVEFPPAETDKAVTLAMPHANGTAAYLFTQGNDTNLTQLNNAFNIMYNSGDIKLSAEYVDNGYPAFRTWKFAQDGSVTFPDSTIQTTAFSNVAVANYLAHYDGTINFTSSPAIINVGTISTLTANVNSSITFGDHTVQTTAYTGFGNANVAAYLPTYTGNISLGNINHTLSAPIGINFTGGPQPGSYTITSTMFSMPGLWRTPYMNMGYQSTGAGTYVLLQGAQDTGIQLIANSTGAAQTWSFNSNSAIIFPDNTVQTTAYTGGGGDGVKYSGILDAYSNDFTVTTQQLVLVTNNGVTNRNITLPASPAEGRTVTIKNTSAFTSWGITVKGNGKNIEGSSSDYSMPNTNGRAFTTFVYSAASSNGASWWVVAKG